MNAEVINMRRSADLPKGAIPLPSLAARVEAGEPLTGAERLYIVRLIAEAQLAHSSLEIERLGESAGPLDSGKNERAEVEKQTS